MTFNQVLLIIRSRLRVALGILCAAILLALLIGLFLPKEYTATASVVIDAKTDPVGAGAGYTDQLLASYVGTQLDVIASERVAQKAVKAVKLSQVPQLQKAWQSRTNGAGDINVWIAQQVLGRKLFVTPGRESQTHQGNVINISVAWSDPKTAAALANAFAQGAIDTSIELKIEPAKQYASWFEQRSQALRSDLEAKQKRLSDFQNATGIIATDEKLDVENTRLAELSSQLVQIQGLRQDSQSRQRQTSGGNESLPEVLQSPVIAKLKDDLSEAEAKQSDLAGRLGRNHPDSQAAAAEVANLRVRIAQESAKIAESLGGSTQINLRRESDVRAALEQQKKRVLDLKHEHDEAAVLQNDVVTAQRDLDAVTQRFAQSSLESQAQQTNIVQLSTATEPFQPSAPRLSLWLLAGIFIGVFAGCGTALVLELMDPRVRGEDELSQLLGVPMLVKIGSMKASGDVGRSRSAPPRLEPASI